MSVPAAESATIHFGYQNFDNRAVSGSAEKYTYPRLISIQNGYGGSLTYEYGNDGRGTNSWYNWRVSKATVSSGVSTAAVHGYAYSGPVYVDPGTNLGELVGYSDATETTYDFNGTTKLADAAHHFGTTGLDVGRELWTQWLDAGGTVLRKVVNTYVTDNSQAPFPSWNYRYLYQTENYEKSGSSLALTSKTIYVRDPATGNLSLQEDYLGSALYRRHYYEYRSSFNPAIHILDKVTRALLADANNVVYADTRYHYGGGAPGGKANYMHPPGGGGGYGSNGETVDAAGGVIYGEQSLARLYLGSGGGKGGEGCFPNHGCTYGGPGAPGGGAIFVAAYTLAMSGSITAIGGGGIADGGASGSGGSIRIESNTVSAGNASAPGGTNIVAGGVGRIAVYYQTSLGGFSSSPAAYTALLGAPPTLTPTPTSITFPEPQDWGTGEDGDLTIGAGTTFNITANGSNGRTCADAAVYYVTELSSLYARTFSSPPANCLKNGDEILLINLQGTINTQTYLPSPNIGNYEFLRVGSVDGNTVSFTTPKTRFYGANAGGDTNIGTGDGQQHVALMRVPNYRNVTINGTLTVYGWNRYGYGTIVFRASGSLTGSGVINANMLGYQSSYSPDRSTGEDYTGYWGWTPHPYGAGWGARSRKAGGSGAYGTNGCNGFNGSWGGLAYGEPALDKLYLGSAGGWSGGSWGGNGGGIIYLLGKTISFSGTVTSNGYHHDLPGGGAGGSIRIEGRDVSLGTLRAISDGGCGGDGRVAVYYVNSAPVIGSSNPAPYIAPLVPPTPTPTPTATPQVMTPQPPQDGWAATDYTYTAAIPHAVTSLSSGNSYGYDANGNMVSRTLSGVSYALTYNAENRLVSYSGIGLSAMFTYDGDGNKTSQTINGVTTYYYMGGLYEVTGTSVRKYYAIAGQSIAMDDGDGLKYFLTDQLSSFAAVTDDSGGLLSSQRYLPFGQVRQLPNYPTITQTDYAYTGQRDVADIGLMDYKARYYDASLGRFIQPDSIVPEPWNPQNLNRYSYVFNEPLRYNDPSGHVGCIGKNWDDGPQCLKNPNSQLSIVVAITKYQKECASGKNKACPGGTKGMAAFGVSAVVTAGLSEYALLGGGAADSIEASLWWLQRSIWKAGWWINGELLPTAAAYLLTKLGLDSPLSPALVNFLADIGTHNPESNSFVVGSYDAYIQTGDSAGYSYYSIPEKSYELLAKAGDKFWQAPNGLFIDKMMNANKALFIDQAEIAKILPGKGLNFELNLLQNYWK
jgi:RHS repeat-associated protein